MKIELLNVLLAIQKSTVTVDKYGNHKNEWETGYRIIFNGELYNILGVDHMS